MKVAIIGAGASGMTAALQATRHGASVTLFERNPVVGRKLLVTGSGHCNLTNEKVTAAKYSCADQAWMEILLKRFGVKNLLDMLASLGLPVYKTSDGWYYPLSNSAQSVVEAFSCALNQAGVTTVTKAQVASFKVFEKGFKVDFSQDGKQQAMNFDRVIVAAGGMAYPDLGSRGELFPLLERLEHTVVPLRPALAPIIADLGNLSPLKGIRLDVGTTLWSGSKQLATTTGNLIFTDWGLNGPAVMDLSHHVDYQNGTKFVLSLNLLAFFQDEFDQLMVQKRESPMPVEIFLNAFFPPKVTKVLLACNQMPEGTPLNQVEDSTLSGLIAQLKDTRLTVKGVRGFEHCQVSAGGVPVDEVNPRTLESRRVKGLFLTGETLDVVGPCGGYNLQFAFSSGALAGKAVAGGENH